MLIRTVYVAGRMTGKPQSNRAAFDAEARRLRALGYTVHSPVEKPGLQQHVLSLAGDGSLDMSFITSDTYAQLLREDFRLVLDSDAIQLLEDPFGMGASHEVYLATILHIPIFDASKPLAEPAPPTA